jgi:hypothetical protein
MNHKRVSYFIKVNTKKPGDWKRKESLVIIRRIKIRGGRGGIKKASLIIIHGNFYIDH